MKKKNVWLMIGVVLAVILLLFWLFAGTILEEESNSEVNPATIEQNI